MAGNFPDICRYGLSVLSRRCRSGIEASGNSTVATTRIAEEFPSANIKIARRYAGALSNKGRFTSLPPGGAKTDAAWSSSMDRGHCLTWLHDLCSKQLNPALNIPEHHASARRYWVN